MSASVLSGLVAMARKMGVQIVAEGVGLSFGPDTLPEARNRGYTLATPGKHRRYRKPRA